MDIVMETKKAYQERCRKHNLDTDIEAYDALRKVIRTAYVSEDEKKILQNYLDKWYSCFEREFC